jgi:hypothetical protein
MNLERIAGKTCVPPFPAYARLVDTLAAAHEEGSVERDATVAHVLATLAGYAYADTETVATMMARVGFEAEACVRISQVVDAMFICSTAYLLQSRCGRVVILCYRGTEPTNLASWLGDTDIGSQSSLLSPRNGSPAVRVHAGFHLNVRATWWSVVEELKAALGARSLLEPGRSVEHPLEALYVAGHSLGGAMAVLFALTIAGDDELRPIGSRLRAVYTYGQPMAVCEPLPVWTGEVAGRLVRHVIARDPVPALPPAKWGPFAHLGQEFRLEEEGWRRAESPVAQLAGARDIARFMVAALAPERRRGSYPYSLGEHGPQHYLAALRPSERITELGD